MVEFNQQEDGRFLPGFGGDVANVAVSAVRQGANAALISSVGDDQFGRDLRQFWRTEGVNDEHVLASAHGETGLYFVTHDGNGHHFTYRRKRSAASAYSVEDLPKTDLESCKIFYASGISLAVSETMRAAVEVAARIAKAGGAWFAFDPNLRTKLWPLDEASRSTHAVMKMCDIALPSLEDARQLTGYDKPEEIVAFYHDLGASEVVVTLGADGVLASDGNDQQFIASMRIDALDATGAGDCFTGAYLAGRLRGQSVFEAARWANVAAALSTCGLGAVAPVPTLQETHKHISAIGTHDDH